MLRGLGEVLWPRSRSIAAEASSCQAVPSFACLDRDQPLSPAAATFGSDFTMKGPREELRVPEKAHGPETSSVGVAMHGLIRVLPGLHFTRRRA
ncbi:MAG: hypothetical protein MZU97_07670 [Bacillus subtilis]|nr:hypothetical protein [Bacillus subtilis]